MKTKVTHWRTVFTEETELTLPTSLLRNHGLLSKVDPRGGFTTVELVDRDKKVYGVAYCSEKDNYNKKIGRMIATGRAMKDLGKVA
jgi:hypothetical protein